VKMREKYSRQPEKPHFLSFFCLFWLADKFFGFIFIE